MSGNDNLKPTVAEVVCEDGLCSVGRPLGDVSLSSRKLGIAATGDTTRAASGVPSAPKRRPFLVDLLHGNVDLESFFDK